jgi:two-component system, response regulator PdtaR
LVDNKTVTATCRPKVVIADDHPATLRAVIALLTEEYQVVAAVEDGDLALEAVEQFQPELVLLDICMPRLDGFRTVRELKIKGFAGAIVFLTGQEDEDYLSAARDLGVLGYVLKSRMGTDLVRALSEALARKAFAQSQSGN